MLNVTFTTSYSPKSQAVAILINEQLKLSSDLLTLDQQYSGIITKTIDRKLDFQGKFANNILLSTTNNGEVKSLIIVGMGDEQELTFSHFERLGGTIFNLAQDIKAETVAVITPDSINSLTKEVIACALASGATLKSYRFAKYFSKQQLKDKWTIKKLEVLSDNLELAEQLFTEKKAVAQGVFLARDCINEPPNVLYPESYAQMISDKLSQLGVEVEILGEREMKNLKMGALLAVGQGSHHESKLVVMKYEGGKVNAPPVALVGKGVTFDSGGISLKPAASMFTMKYDMAGSAAVVGTIKALALRKAKVNVTGVVGLVENMPGGNAQRPGDVVTTMSGQTAEVLNTDAEGRLVLADAIWYAQDEFKPTCVIDVATLTGAIITALGNTYGGLFTNNDDLAAQLIAAGLAVDEKLWRMPLSNDYDKLIKSDIADMANIGGERGLAGSSTAAHFIGRFIKEGVRWAHLDIAGMAWEQKGSAICPKGAVGYGIRLLNQFIKENHESQ